MIGPLSRVIVFVQDTRRLAEFYRDVLGLQPVGEWTSEWAELDGGGCHLAFHQSYIQGNRGTHPTGSPNNPHKIVFRVEDVDKARAELVAKGAKMEEVLRFPEMGNLVFCDGTDPEGHRFQICNR